MFGTIDLSIGKETNRLYISSSLLELLKMKLALIFLSALMAMTHQQFQPSGGRPAWWSPYSYPAQLPSMVADRREIYYYNNFQDDVPSIRRFRPVRPATYFPAQQNVELDSSLKAADYYHQDDLFNTEEDYPDMHSRKKVSEIHYQPFWNNQATPQQQQRFLLNYYRNINSILTKTVSFTVTSTVSLTTVQSCIAAANFLDAAAQATPCRRKRDILENAPEDVTQFVIAPSETQRVTPTALASLDVMRENRQLPASSVDDQISGSMSSPVDNLRAKRFLNYSVTSVTVTAYSFLSATVTKTVAIGGAAAVLCLPSGWSVC